MSALKRHYDLTAIWRNEPGWRGYLRSVNHSDIGKRFIVAAFAFFAIGGVLAMLIRAQLATPRSAFVGPEVYNQLFTMHGSIMMFLFAIPMFEGLTMYLLPKMLGSRDLAFPRLSSLGWWCYLFGGTIIVIAMLAGVAPDAGWFLYPPLSGKTYTPGINSDVWLLGVTFVEISAMCAAIEITVSILKLRAAGMRLDRMPIFAWYLLATAGMMVFGFPPLILGSILLEVERAFGWPFYSPELGGSPLLWQHLFWLFGHPEVYIIFLPAAGAVSTILPVMARTRLLGHGAIVAAIGARFPQLRAVGTPYVHHRHSAYGARLLLGGVRAGGDPDGGADVRLARYPVAGTARDEAADALSDRFLHHVRDWRPDRRDASHGPVRRAGARHRLRHRASSLCAGRRLRLPHAGRRLLLAAAFHGARAGDARG